MSRDIPPSRGQKSKKRPRFPLRSYVNPHHPKGRYKTNGSGVIENEWDLVNAFEICEGAEKGGVVAMYDSRDHPREATIDLLLFQTYTDFLARGTIHRDHKELRFTYPYDAEECRDCLVNACDDTEFLRHFGHFKAFGPGGESFGIINDLFIRSNGS